ncbi:MAG: YgiT-type zinc finger protein [Acidobacteria bacterium]|nr:YgiT-type zinc finger protein [Acidobacteriota bacterium]
MSASAEFQPPRERKAYPSACPLCGGSIREERVTLHYAAPHGTTRLVHEVPAGVCQSCAERYLRPDVAEKIEHLLSAPPAGREEVPVWNFAASA